MSLNEKTQRKTTTIYSELDDSKTWDQIIVPCGVHQFFCNMQNFPLKFWLNEFIDKLIYFIIIIIMKFVLLHCTVLCKFVLFLCRSDKILSYPVQYWIHNNEWRISQSVLSAVITLNLLLLKKLFAFLIGHTSVFH